MLKRVRGLAATAALGLGVVALGAGAPGKAEAQDFYLGQIIMGGWNFCPRGTTQANGQLLAISQFSALFALYGTTYGGDGRTTFGLPDLRGRSPVHEGQGPGLSNVRLGQKGGTETTTLGANNLPSHSHPATSTATTTVQISGTTANGNANTPSNALPAVDGADFVYNNSAAADNPMSAAMATGSTDVTTTIGNTGGGQSFDNRSPYQAIEFCVVFSGIFPPRS